VGPRAVLEAVVKRKIPSPRRKSNPKTPIIQPVAQRYTTEISRQDNNVSEVLAASIFRVKMEAVEWYCSES
jgi:translation elongation factor EF-G